MRTQSRKEEKGMNGDTGQAPDCDPYDDIDDPTHDPYHLRSYCRYGMHATAIRLVHKAHYYPRHQSRSAWLGVRVRLFVCLFVCL